MVISTDRFEIRSRNSNLHYWEQDVYPAWTSIRTFRHVPGEPAGVGVEPHYHDNDEMWLFASGHGEVWVDGISYKVTPNTMVYTPMGSIHRFQMFAPYDNNAIVTWMEREGRAAHLTVEEHGPPRPVATGFVVPGAQNTGPIADPGPRCPLSEWRMASLASGETAANGETSQNEFWMVTTGSARIVVEGWEIELWQEDMALLRAGTSRRVYTKHGANMMLARERRVV